MAVSKISIDVNSGQTGWTKTQVMDALGDLFGELDWAGVHNSGMLGGDSCVAPGNGWSAVGGTVSGLSTTTSYFWTVEDYYDVGAGRDRKGGTFRITRNSSGNVIDIKPHLGSVYYNYEGGMTVGGLGWVDPKPSAMGYGWRDNDTFTIPGQATGGVSPDNDITFGVNDATTPAISVYSSNGWDGVNFNSPWFWEDNESYSYGDGKPVRFLKLDNDGGAGAEYGSTYWMFRNYQSDSDTFMEIGCASMIDVGFRRFGGVSGVDKYGYTTSYNPGADNSEYGWGPLPGQTSSSYYGPYSSTTNTCASIRFCRTSAPTSYPLTINAYVDPSDMDYAVISFTQDVNGTVETHGTFWLYKGSGMYNGLVDLEAIAMDTWGPIGPSISNQAIALGFGGVNVNTSSQYPEFDRRYGHTRYASAPFRNTRQFSETATFDSNSSVTPWDWAVATADHYVCPIREKYTGVGYSSDSAPVVMYYRNSAMQTDNQVDGTTTDFYRPFTSLPVTTNMLPIPGYLPEGFAMIPFEVSPGAATFFQGDTITVSASEVYTVVVASYTQNENTGAYSRGVAFCARTV